MASPAAPRLEEPVATPDTATMITVRCRLRCREMSCYDTQMGQVRTFEALEVGPEWSIFALPQHIGDALVAEHPHYERDPIGMRPSPEPLVVPPEGHPESPGFSSGNEPREGPSSEEVAPDADTGAEPSAAELLQDVHAQVMIGQAVERRGPGRPRKGDVRQKGRERPASRGR